MQNLEITGLPWQLLLNILLWFSVSTVGGTAILTSSLNQVKTRPKTIAARPKGPVSTISVFKCTCTWHIIPVKLNDCIARGCKLIWEYEVMNEHLRYSDILNI